MYAIIFSRAISCVCVELEINVSKTRSDSIIRFNRISIQINPDDGDKGSLRNVDF
jgi:hypothetical protein